MVMCTYCIAEGVKTNGVYTKRITLFCDHLYGSIYVLCKMVLCEPGNLPILMNWITEPMLNLCMI